MNFYIVDAFTETVFGGNPAGVVIIPNSEPFPSEDVMRKTAAELRYSETAFVKQLSHQLFQTRYFTPIEEVDLCGHATIATFQALLNAGIVNNNSIYYNDTLAGKLAIEIKNNFIWMEMATPKAIGQINDPISLLELYRIMGLDYNASKSDIYPELISTGLPDIILPVSSKEDLENINPDFFALSKLSEKYNVVGIHAFVIPNNSFELNQLPDNDSTLFTTHCRNFAPLYGINEEAATGTANGALTYFLYKNGILKEGMQSMFIQGEAMDRPSQIKTKLTICNSSCNSVKPDIKIQVGGTGIILAQGDINI